MKRTLHLDQAEIEAAVREWLMDQGHVTPGDRVQLALCTNAVLPDPDPRGDDQVRIMFWATITLDGPSTPDRSRSPRNRCGYREHGEGCDCDGGGGPR